MRWISRLLRRRPELAPSPEESGKTRGQQEAESALSRAQEARRAVEAHRHAVSRIAERLAQERERNHFAEMFRQAMQGGHR